MAKQRGGNRTVFISIFMILAIVGIVIGVLFATGVLGKKSSSSGSKPVPPVPRPSPLGPNVPNPAMPTITVTLSNPQFAWISGTGGGIPEGLTFDITYSPGGSVPPVDDYTFNTTAVVTYADGSTHTFTQSAKDIYEFNTISWQPDFTGKGFGLAQNPVKAEVNAYITYQNESNNTINSPVSNTLSVNIPTKY